MTITAEQVEARRKTIGGSDIGAILGENNYKTAYEVWQEKVEGKTIDLSRNKSVVIGEILEEALIEKYENSYKKLCINKNTFYHKDYKFLSANLDAVSVEDFYINKDEQISEKTILEIKTASCFNKEEWGPSGSNIVPKSYYAQIAHYMLVTGYKRADLFVGFVDDTVIGNILCEMNLSSKNGDKPNYLPIVEKMETRLYTFYKDNEIEELILNEAKEFYDSYLKPWIENGEKISPPMDFSNKKFQEYIREKYSIKEDSQINLTDDFIKVKNCYVSAVGTAKNFEKIANEYKTIILEAMGNNQKAILNDGSYFIRKPVKRKEYIVKESEYIKFEFKEPKNSIEGEL